MGGGVQRLEEARVLLARDLAEAKEQLQASNSAVQDLQYSQVSSTKRSTRTKEYGSFATGLLSKCTAKANASSDILGTKRTEAVWDKLRAKELGTKARTRYPQAPPKVPGETVGLYTADTRMFCTRTTGAEEAQGSHVEGEEVELKDLRERVKTLQGGLEDKEEEMKSLRERVQDLEEELKQAEAHAAAARAEAGEKERERREREKERERREREEETEEETEEEARWREREAENERTLQELTAQ
eukprot:3545065-Rhodomonas_salina.1